MEHGYNHGTDKPRPEKRGKSEGGEGEILNVLPQLSALSYKGPAVEGHAP